MEVVIQSLKYLIVGNNNKIQLNNGKNIVNTD